MPTILTHAVAAVSLAPLLAPRKHFSATALLAATAAMLPDADVIGFRYGVAYGAMWGHRGVTHSLAFAILAGAVAWVFSRETDVAARRRAGFYIAAATASHGILDACTNGGLGVAFFAPLSDTRYFFPFAPIDVSPIGFAFFSERGLRVLISEMLWVWIPACALAICGGGKRHRASP